MIFMTSNHYLQIKEDKFRLIYKTKKYISNYNWKFLDFFALSKPPTGRGFSPTWVCMFGYNNFDFQWIKIFLIENPSAMNVFYIVESLETSRSVNQIFFSPKHSKLGQKILYFSFEAKKTNKSILYLQYLHWIVIYLDTKSKSYQKFAQSLSKFHGV